MSKAMPSLLKQVVLTAWCGRLNQKSSGAVAAHAAGTKGLVQHGIAWPFFTKDEKVEKRLEQC